jgi:hypothetical protein
MQQTFGTECIPLHKITTAKGMPASRNEARMLARQVHECAGGGVVKGAAAVVSCQATGSPRPVYIFSGRIVVAAVVLAS